MKFLIDNWHLIVVALASGGMLFWPMVKGATQPGVTPEAAVQLINREKAVVVDVAESTDFAAGHVVGARNVPLSQLEDKLPSTVKNKALPLIMVCRSDARSGRAVALAKKLGYAKVHSLSGGLTAWKAANLPIEKA